jgi:stage V sporulation protein R
MLDTMGNHSTRIRRYIDAFGVEAVERFVDRCLSLDTLIDPYLPLREHSSPPDSRSLYTPPSERALRTLDALSMSPIPQERSVPASEVVIKPLVRSLPTYDVLGFLEENAPLDAWQRDVLHLVRTEAYYFSPQRMTKIMNEGWASFWHSRLLTAGILDASEILDFADCHSGATFSLPGQVNPYKLGIELFRHAERRNEDIFRLRRVHNDVSLVHKLVDEEFALRTVRPLLPRQLGEVRSSELDWRAVKSWLLQQLSWGGLPQIQLVASDAEGGGELLFVHHHDGRDLQLGRAHETLLNLAELWKKPVHLLTIQEKQGRKLIARNGEVSVIDTSEAEERCAGGEGRETSRKVRREVG